MAGRKYIIILLKTYIWQGAECTEKINSLAYQLKWDETQLSTYYEFQNIILHMTKTSWKVRWNHSYHNLQKCALKFL